MSVLLNDELNEKEIIENFHDFLVKKSIPDNLNNIARRIEKNSIYMKNAELRSLIKAYKKIPQYKSICSKNSSVDLYKQEEIICKRDTCDGIIEIDNESSEMICRKCGEITTIVGNAHENMQLYVQEGQCMKQPSYERKKHGEKWINRIQAKENVNIQKNLIKDIKRHLRTLDIRDVRKVTCELLRHCLKKIGKTKFNEHVALIRYLITGIAPPRLTEEEYNETLFLFDVVVDAFEQIKNTEMHNCPYHPYFIRRILENILPEVTYEEYYRKCQIISNIHIQSDTTLRKRDHIWEEICKMVPKLNDRYTPTDKSKYKVPI